jgi:hypothetical protein
MEKEKPFLHDAVEERSSEFKLYLVFTAQKSKLKFEL